MKKEREDIMWRERQERWKDAAEVFSIIGAVMIGFSLYDLIYGKENKESFSFEQAFAVIAVGLTAGLAIMIQRVFATNQPNSWKEYCQAHLPSVILAFFSVSTMFLFGDVRSAFCLMLGLIFTYLGNPTFIKETKY